MKKKTEKSEIFDFRKNQVFIGFSMDSRFSHFFLSNIFNFSIFLKFSKTLSEKFDVYITFDMNISWCGWTLVSTKIKVFSEQEKKPKSKRGCFICAVDFRKGKKFVQRCWLANAA